MFKELLPRYTVDCELDEGMAVLFHSIDRMIQSKQFENGHWYHALTIDCGGTTDLTSGRFRIDNTRVSYLFDLAEKVKKAFFQPKYLYELHISTQRGGEGQELFLDRWKLSVWQDGSLPYEIMAYTHENQEKILVKSLDPEDHIGYISRFRIGRQLDLYLNDERGERLKTYCYTYDTARFRRTTQEAIDQRYRGTVIQEETDTILEGEMKFFVWVSKRRWGFVVLPILRDGEQLYTDEEKFYDFEDDTWEMNFFDGKK